MTFNFGAPQNQAQPSTSLFGNTATANQPKATFGGFQTPNPQQSQGQNTNLFGTPSNATQPTNSLFGNTTQPPPQQGGGLFGQTNPTGQAAGGGGLFGSTNNQAAAEGGGGGSGLFGANNQAGAGGGLFGAAGNNTAQQPSTGLFGATNSQQPTQPSTGLFGQSTTQQPTGGLFGGSTTQQQTTQPTGLFGSTNNNTTTGGLFGGQSQQSQTQAQQQGGSSSFGQNNQNQGTGGLGSSLFGNTNTNTNTNTNHQASGSGLFGQSQNQQQSSLFGGSAQNTGTGLFGSTNQNQSQNQNQNQNQDQRTGALAGSIFGSGSTIKPEQSIEERIKGIHGAWDPNSPDCRFKYYFYNVVEAGTAERYGLPPGAQDDDKWKQARRDNPDPNSMVPVLATGWDHVKKRSEMQVQIASVHQERIKEIKLALDELTRKASLTSAIRLQTLQTQLQALQHHLIHLVAQIPAVMPNPSPIRSEENDIKLKLEAVKEQVDGKGGKRLGGNGREGRLIGQVNELWGVVEELRRRRKIREGGREGWLSDEKSLNEVAQILATQQQALQKLTELTKDALFDTEVMRSDLGLITQRSD